MVNSANPETEFDELFEFLSHSKLEVRNMACKIVSGLSTVENHGVFNRNQYEPVKALMKLTTDEPLPKNINADLSCMLLNNLSKHETCRELLFSLQVSRTHRLDNLLELYSKPSKQFNKSAEFHFLGGVFANLTCSPEGVSFFLQKSTVDGTLRLSKIIQFTSHPDIMRRGGTVSTLKNVCFGASVDGEGLTVLFDESLDLLVHLLLPLCGPEEYDDDESEGLPDALQLLEDTKEREVDIKLRMMLSESLLLLAGTRSSREKMRAASVYHVIKKYHMWERSEEIQEVIESLVNMLMRDEEPLPIDEPLPIN